MDNMLVLIILINVSSYSSHHLCIYGAIGCRKRKLHVSVTVSVPLVRVLSQKSLAPRVTSVTSIANDKGDNEMIRGLCTDLLAFALQLRKTPENLS